MTSLELSPGNVRQHEPETGPIVNAASEATEAIERSQIGPRGQDGRAVLIVISSFVLTLTACGLNFAFGVYQELYETLGGPFANASPAQIDLIGTLGVSLMTMGAPFASAWTKS